MSPARVTVDDVFDGIDAYIKYRTSASAEGGAPTVITVSEHQAKLIEAWALNRRQDKVGLGRDHRTIVSYRGISVKVTGR